MKTSDEDKSKVILMVINGSSHSSSSIY